MAPAGARYDVIGDGYARARRPDARIAAPIERALGDAVTVVNVGAGAGSYESPHRRVVAIEPSEAMVRQRPPGSAPAILGVAEALPLADASVDAATAFLTVHHWSDRERGLRELRRVARGAVVVLTYMPGAIDPASSWITHRYFPLIEAADARIFPPASLYEGALGACTFERVPIPADCSDGFLHAYWSRPERYLDAEVRKGISGFRLLPVAAVDEGLARLERDLETGAWDAMFGALRSQREFDAGLRLVIARPL